MKAGGDFKWKNKFSQKFDVHARRQTKQKRKGQSSGEVGDLAVGVTPRGREAFCPLSAALTLQSRPSIYTAL